MGSHDDGAASPGVGSSPAFLAMIEQAARLAPVPRPLLIRGERGTGKELLARFIHQRSGRRADRYVVVNCAAFPSELFDAAMLGHEKGAFTGAHGPGKLEQAHGGTLFLDEVANMPRSGQQKLLRVIEYQRFERVGGTESIAVDVRVIAETNADLDALMRSGDFLPDLYDRLCFAELVLPPLRKRRDDIPHLIEACVEQLHREIPDLEPKRFTASAIEDLKAYHWPGNVRQLRNVVERLYISDADGLISSSELPLEITSVEPLGRSFEERRARREAMELEAKGGAASILENGQAQLQVLGQMITTYQSANGEGEKIFMLNMLPELLAKLADTVGRVTIDKLSVIDAGGGGAGNGVSRFVTQLPGAVISLAEQIETATGVHILGPLQAPEAAGAAARPSAAAGD